MRLADRYRLLKQVGEGGGGGVYLVEDRLADDAVMVLKRLHAQAQAGLAQWLVNEFQVLAQLELPTVARVYDFGLAEADATDAGGTFFTRAYVDGAPLDEALRVEGGAPDAVTLRRLFASAAQTLRELHRLGVVHGDLKPANLIVPPSRDTVTFIDFGLAHGALGAAATIRGGTLAYMPPERVEQLQAGIALAPDPRADVYGLAVSLLQVLGATSIHAEAPPAVMADPALVSLWDLAQRGASPDPARRFASMDDLLVTLGEDRGTTRRPGPRVVLRPEGRENELGAMLDVVARRLVRREPGGGAVLLSGDEGSGRSTLLRELTWRAQLRGVQVLSVACEAGDGPARRLRQGATILGGGGADDDSLEGVAEALKRAARHAPVLVLVDDLDRADPAIATLLRSVAFGCDAGEALLVVATAADVARVAALEATVRVTLGALDATAVANLCAQILGAVEPAVVTAVHRRTQGLPLAVTEVLEALAREAAVTPADVDAIAVSGRARDVAVRRITALSPAAREAAAVVAALSGDADEVRLGALAPWKAVHEGRAAGVLREGADGRWALAHGALAEALAEAMGPDAMIAVYRKVATLLDGTNATVTARALAWVRAREPALAPIEQAVGALRGEGLPLAAARLLASARAIDPSRATPDALLMEAELLHEGGMAAEAEEIAARVGIEAGSVGTRALLLRGRLRRLAGELDAAERLLASARATAESTLVAEAMVESARVAMTRGDYATVAAHCEAAVDGATPPVGAAARALAGLAAVYAGDAAKGTVLLEEARAAYASLALPREEAAMLVYLGVGRERAGDLPGARTLHAQSLERARAAGDLRGMVSARINLGHIAQRMGELGDAIEHTGAALGLAQRAGLRSEIVTARLNMASQLIRIGSLDRARVELDGALALAREMGHRDLAAAATLMLGCAHARSGDVDGGMAMVSEAHTQFVALGQADDAADALLDGAEILMDRADTGDAERAGERVARAREAVGGPLGLREARARCIEGAVALARGDARAATLALDAACAQAEAQRDWEVQAQALATRARVHASVGADLHARRDRERAVEVLEDRAGVLSPDLRGAFWGVPWRAALRTALAPTAPVAERSAFGAVLSSRGGLTTSMGGRAPTLIANDDRLVLLLEMSRRVGEEQSVERVLDQAVRSAVELTNAERGAVLLPGADGALAVRASIGPMRGDGPDDSFSRSIAETVWIDGEPVVTLNARGDQRFADFRSVHDLGIAAIAAVPIRVRGRTVGVLYVENRKRRVAWSTTDVALMSAFAEQAGVAVEHVRLVEELEARGRDLERARREIEALLETRTTELEHTRRSLARAEAALKTQFTPEGLIAQTESMRRLFSVIERVRDTDVPVVVEGESGTGKELIARALHFSGARARGPFVVVHCGALPETLLESELFGHVRGAFTGADRDRKGLIASAHGGTLLLDEVSEMSPKMQVELLRVLQERRVRPVGAEHEEAVDIRVLVACNRPLKDLVSEGRFREDLYYRLAVVTLRVPPLRERLDDVPLLVQHFLAALAEEHGGRRKRLSRDALAKLLQASWPGNVRQLRHTLESAAVMCDGDVIEADALAVADAPKGVTESAPGATAASPSVQRRSAERQKIVNALEEANWNKVRAADLLGMPRRTLYRRLREYGLLD